MCDQDCIRIKIVYPHLDISENGKLGFITCQRSRKAFIYQHIQTSMVNDMGENVYKMKPGEYIDEDRVEDLADELFADNPLIEHYEASVYETSGSKKNHLYFEYELIDRQKAITEFSYEEQKRVIELVNEFLEEVTGRGTDLRKNDLKKD